MRENMSLSFLFTCVYEFIFIIPHSEISVTSFKISIIVFLDRKQNHFHTFVSTKKMPNLRKI